MNEQEISEMMTNSLDSFKSMKSEQWLASGTRSMQPTAIMVSRGGKPYPVPGDLLGPAQDNIFDGDLADAVGWAFGLVSALDADDEATIELAAVAADAYIKTVSVEEHQEAEYQRGDMADEFASKPDTEVREAIVVTSVYFDAVNQKRMALAKCQYSIGDGGAMIFGVPDVLCDLPVSGRVADSLASWLGKELA